MSTAIAIFVKTPSLSPIKTRLAETIGKENAEEFYRLSLNAVAKTAQEINAKFYWAVAEKEGVNNPIWLEFESTHTGKGELGERQYNIYSALLENHENVILVGADAPQISANIINQAIEELKKNDFVVGPANDGGYYLFGGCKEVKLDIWNAVPWSSNTTREIFESLLPSKPTHLEFLTDVDIYDDLQAACNEMPNNLSDEQIEIIKYITTL